jgi:hypothetical protein
VEARPTLSRKSMRSANVMPYGALMLAARMTLPHFLVSSKMSFPKSPPETNSERRCESAMIAHGTSRALTVGRRWTGVES